MPSDRELPRLPLECSPDSVAIAFCVQGVALWTVAFFSFKGKQSR